MARLLSNEEAQKLLSSPDLSTTAPVIKGDGMVLGLIRSLLKPATNYGKHVGELTNYGNQAKKTRIIPKGVSVEEATKYKPKYVSDEEWDVLKRNPTAKVAQDIAGVASYFVPGSGVKSAIASGALYGASQGDNVEDVIGNTLTGAVTGGAVAGGVKIAGKVAKGALSKVSPTLQKAADKQKNGSMSALFGYKVPATKGGSNVVENGVKYGYNRLSSVDDVFNAANKASDDLYAQAQTLVRQGVESGAKISPKELITPYLQTLKNPKISNLEKQPLKEVLDQFVQDIGGTITPKGTYKLPANVDLETILGKSQAYGKMGKWNQFTPAADVNKAGHYEDLYSSMRDAVNKSLESKGVKGFRELNKQISENIEIAGAARVGMARDIPVKPINLADLTAMGFGAMGAGPVGSAAAYGAKKILNSSKAQNVLSDTLQKGANVTAGVNPMFKNPILKKVFNSANAGRLGAAGSMMPQEVGTEMESMSEPMEANTQATTKKGVDNSQRRANEFAKLIAQGVKISDAKSIVETMFPDVKADAGQSLTEGQKKYVAAGEQAQKALQLLESGKVSVGPLEKIINGAKGTLDMNSSDQNSYQSKLAAARGSAINALAGANVPPSEYKRIADMIPDLSDPPKKAKDKLKAFIEAMNDYATAGS